MSDLFTVERLLCRHAGIDLQGIRQEEARRVSSLALPIFVAAINNHPLRDQRPDILEQKLEEVRSEIRALVKRIAALDPWAVAVARRVESQRELEAAGTDVEAIKAAMKKARDVPKEEWPDKAAIFHLNRLEEGLQRPIETLIRIGKGMPDGRGAKPNLVARKVALAAGSALSDLTGERLSYWSEGTAFAKLTADVFLAFGINADTRRACEWALSELGHSS